MLKVNRESKVREKLLDKLHYDLYLNEKIKVQDWIKNIRSLEFKDYFVLEIQISKNLKLDRQYRLQIYGNKSERRANIGFKMKSKKFRIYVEKPAITKIKYIPVEPWITSSCGPIGGELKMEFGKIKENQIAGILVWINYSGKEIDYRKKPNYFEYPYEGKIQLSQNYYDANRFKWPKYSKSIRIGVKYLYQNGEKLGKDEKILFKNP